MLFAAVHTAIAVTFATELLLAHPCLPRRFPNRPSARFLLAVFSPSVLLLTLAVINGSILETIPALFSYSLSFTACARRTHYTLPLLAVSLVSLLSILFNGAPLPVPLTTFVLSVDVICIFRCTRTMLQDSLTVEREGYASDGEDVTESSMTLLAMHASSRYGATDPRIANHASAAETGTAVAVSHGNQETVSPAPYNSYFEKFFSILRCASYRLPSPLRIAAGSTFDLWGSCEDNIAESVDNSTRTVPPNVRTASLLGILGFHWMNPLVVLGRRESLEVEHMPKLAPHLRSLATGPEKFDRIWREEVARGGNHRLWRSLVRAFGRKLLLGIGMRSIDDTLLLIGPLILRQLIRHLQFASEHPSEPYIVKKGVLLSAALMVLYMTSAVLFQHYCGNCAAVHVQTQGCIVTTIYSKSIKISSEARSRFTSGFIQNLMSTDSRTLADLAFYLDSTWSGADQIILSLVLLISMLGIIPTLAGTMLIILTCPVQKEFVEITRKVREQASAWTDNRVKTISEAMSDMQIVKLMAWESSFIKRITEARLGELKLVRIALNVQAATYSLVNSIPVGLSLVTFGTYAWMGGVLDAAVVFPAISLFAILEINMFIIPRSIIEIARASAAVERIQRFLDADELKSLRDSPEYVVSNESFERMDAEVIAIGASFLWNRNLAGTLRPTLSNISCVIPRGSLTCIVGPTAAGKSTFLSAVIGEAEIIAGRIGVRCGSRTALCCQTPFIRSSTLRDNVLFGLPLDMERYKRTLRVCNLLPDILTLPAGDLTEIGDRGTNLSGGQKARVSLARAVYSQHEIVLMDAPLAAVDAHVARSIFDNCVVNEMSGRTRIMTTNSMNFASSPDVDHIVVLMDGKMVEFGKSEELMADATSHFARMIASETVNDFTNRVYDSISDSVEDDDELDGTIIMENMHSSTKKNRRGQRKAKLAAAIASHDESGIKDAGEHMMNKQKFELVSEADRNRRGELFHREFKEVGRVKPRHYVEYMNAIGGIKWAAFIVSLAALSQILSMGVNVWLRLWSERTRVETTETVMAEQTRYLLIYTSICVGAMFFIGAKMYALASASIRASVWLHEKLVLSIFGAPMSFFDTTPTGRIVNRFNASIDRIDNSLMFSIRSVLNLSLSLGLSILLILVSIPGFIFILVPVAIIFLLMRDYFRRTVIDLRRLESVSRSPLYSHFGETLDGVMTIRAYGAIDRMMAENRDLADIAITTCYASNSSNRWLSIRLGFVTCGMLFGVSSIAVASYRTVSPELSGLVLTYAIEVIQRLAWYIRQLTETESYFSSIEQISEYTTIPPFPQEEKQLADSAEQVNMDEVENLKRNQSWGLVSERLVREITVDRNLRPNQLWPRRGLVKFANVTMRYRPGLKPALENLTMEIMPGWHVGIVGRTGAGKSSLIGTLFRLQEIERGQISIDDQDISALRLKDLRRSLSVIAQDPVLFSGTIRSNLDMTGSYNDEEVQRAFNKCGLKETTPNELTLDSEVSEGGANFSAGQRQLLCLGRALLRDSKVLVLDEATASLDDFTDRKLGETIRREMGHCTIITVAHRLHTVMRSTRVCVLDKGRVVEFDEPRALLERVPKSAFARMVEETGPKTAKYLHSLAYMSRVPSDLFQSAHTMKTNNEEHLRDKTIGAFRFLRSAVAEVESEEWLNELQRNNLTVKTWKRSLYDMVSALTSLAQDNLIRPRLESLSISKIDDSPEEARHLE